MPESIVFYTNPMSRGRIVRWMLEEVGEPYTTEIIAYGPAMKGADYKAINPMGKVPALRHGNAIVTEAAAICAYLAEAFPEKKLLPQSDAQRAAYHRWMFFCAGPFETAVTLQRFGYVPPAERAGMMGWGSFDAVMDALEGAVTNGPYLLGEHFTAADVYVGSQIGFGLAFNSIEKRPAFERYWAGLEHRPAAVRAREIDDKLIAEQQKQAS